MLFLVQHFNAKVLKQVWSLVIWHDLIKKNQNSLTGFVHPFVIVFYLKAVVSPASKFHFTVLIIERKPGYINGTGRHEDARRYISANALTGHNYIGWICCINCLTCTKNEEIMIPISLAVILEEWFCHDYPFMHSSRSKLCIIYVYVV